MTNTEILKKAIEKANKNGFLIKGKTLNWAWFEMMVEMQGAFTRGLIFDHDFAKAFWKEVESDIFLGCSTCNKVIRRWIAWQFHLQQMVLEKEPLQYLRKFLDD